MSPRINSYGLFTRESGVMLAWTFAGYIGLDYFLLQALGTPSRPGVLLRRSATIVPPTEVEELERPQRHAA